MSLSLQIIIVVNRRLDQLCLTAPFLITSSPMTPAERFSDTSSHPPVHGFLHRPESPSGNSLVLTHGAGGNAQMGLLVALAEAFAGAGFAVLRCDLPFRQQRPYGPAQSRRCGSRS